MQIDAWAGGMFSYCGLQRPVYCCLDILYVHILGREEYTGTDQKRSPPPARVPPQGDQTH